MSKILEVYYGAYLSAQKAESIP